jgi:deoxyribodipyrimidine photo-lyase
MQLIWFRNDLRVEDNPALYQADQDRQQPLVAVYCYCPQQWQEYGIGENHQALVLQQLEVLESSLKKLNIKLYLLNSQSFAETPMVLKSFCQIMQINDVYFNVEYGYDERTRDKKLVDNLQGISQCHRFAGDSLMAPWRILNDSQNPYKVYSAYARKFRQLISDQPLYRTPSIEPLGAENINWVNNKFESQISLADSIQTDPSQTDPVHTGLIKLVSIESLLKNNQSNLKVPQLHYQSVKKNLIEFCQTSVHHYPQKRDIPSVKGTSFLSPALCVGVISATDCYLTAQEIAPNESEKWLNELVWRDFYRAVMWHFPRVSKGLGFNPIDNFLKWQQQDDEVEKFYIGETGIPIIDAAIKQLLNTGWMHNRLRMITASYFCKNLWADWRLGEAFFAKHLIDYDFASNNGGWQWCASVGTDAAPYFRVFNPQSQQKNYDPQTDFIKMWLPDLADYPAKSIHAYDKNNLGRYPTSQIDLKQSRQQAIEAFKNTKLWLKACQE